MNLQVLIMKEIINQNKYYYLTVLVFVVFGGILLFLFTKGEVTLWVNAHYSTLFDDSFLTFDKIGTVWFCAVLLVMLALVKGWRIALQALLCFLAVLLVTQFMKHILFPGALRPTLYFEDAAHLRLVNGVTQLRTETFPSGHTSSAFAMFTYLALILPYKRFHVIFVVIAALVGYGRIYLSQHFITDVYAGMIIGVTVTTVVYLLTYKRSFFTKI